MKSIVLAEKPSVGRELARVLGCNKKEKGYFEGKSYVVSWAMGHLVELAEPEVYNPAYKRWSLATLPMLPDKLKLKVIRKSAGQFNTVKRLFGRKDINELVIATDAGREGELVARWIMRLGGWRGTIKRLWISSQTDSAIKQGFASLKNGRDFDNLFHAAESRAEADWIIGLNVTRALSCKYDVRLSAGRVQTPTVSLVVERENAIKEFVPESFWTVVADFGAYTGTWIGPNGSTRLKEQRPAQNILDKVNDSEGVIEDIQVKEKKTDPPLAYDLTALQGDANRSLGFSAKKTLQVLQSLYERHKIVTYPRTDSRHITPDIVSTLPSRLKALYSTPLEQAARNLLQKDLKPGKRFVDETKVTDHHAIIPTEQHVQLDRLTGDERALWQLVAQRFLEILSPPYRYKQIQIVTKVKGETFISKGIRVIDQGWRGTSGSAHTEPETEEEDATQDLGNHKKGEHHRVRSAELKQGWTKPPPRYTEGTLLAAMENAGRFIEDRELKKSIEKGGLGTPATRAEIIEKIISNFYIERNGKELVPTPRGYELLELAPDMLCSPELTAKWELRLSSIASGKEDHKRFLSDIRKEALRLVDLIKKSTAEYKPKYSSLSPCPLCGKPLYPARNKKGKKILVCQALSCGYEESRDRKNRADGRPSEKEKRIAKKLIHQYSDKSKETTSFGDLLKASLERQKERSKEKKEQ